MLSFNGPLTNEIASRCPIVMRKRAGTSSARFDVEFVMILNKYCDQWEDEDLQTSVNVENSRLTDCVHVRLLLRGDF